MGEEYIKKADVERAIEKRLDELMSSEARGKGLKNSIINLKALLAEIDTLYSIKFKFKNGV